MKNLFNDPTPTYKSPKSLHMEFAVKNRDKHYHANMWTDAALRLRFADIEALKHLKR